MLKNISAKLLFLIFLKRVLLIIKFILILAEDINNGKFI
jgi:hypothetical protein